MKYVMSYRMSNCSTLLTQTILIASITYQNIKPYRMSVRIEYQNITIIESYDYWYATNFDFNFDDVSVSQLRYHNNMCVFQILQSFSLHSYNIQFKNFKYSNLVYYLKNKNKIFWTEEWWYWNNLDR